MHSGTARRGQALVLALILLTGAIGLPVLDAIYFHSAHAAASPAAPALTTVGGGHAHVFGCAVITSAVSGRGLPAAPSAAVTLDLRSCDAAHAVRPSPGYQADLALQLSRAPPSA